MNLPKKLFLGLKNTIILVGKSSKAVIVGLFKILTIIFDTIPLILFHFKKIFLLTFLFLEGKLSDFLKFIVQSIIHLRYLFFISPLLVAIFIFDNYIIKVSIGLILLISLIVGFISNDMEDDKDDEIVKGALTFLNKPILYTSRLLIILVPLLCVSYIGYNKYITYLYPDKYFNIYMDNGTEAFKNKKFDEAIEYYKKSIKIKNDNYNANFYLANAFFNKMEFDKAIEFYKKSANIDPKKYAPYYNIGLSFDGKSDYVSAIGYYEKSLKIAPREYTVSFYIGQSFLKLEKHDMAINHFDKYINSSPNENKGTSCLHIAQVLYVNKKYDDSIVYYKKAIGLFPEKHRHSIYLDIGNSFLYLKKYNDAIESYLKSISLTPTPSAYLNLIETSLISNKPFDKKLEIKFIELFGDDNETMIVYEMLKLLEKVVSNENVNINEIKEKYINKNEFKYFDNWDFSHLDEWSRAFNDKRMSKLLLSILEIFKES